MVPLANMFGYVNTLRSMTQGRAAYTMTFDHYAPVPRPWRTKLLPSWRANGRRSNQDRLIRDQDHDEGEV